MAFNHERRQQFYNWCVYSEHLSPATAHNAAFYADKWVSWLKNDRGLDGPGEVTRDLIFEFLEVYGRQPSKKTGRPPHPNTVRRVFFYLKRWHRFRFEQGWRDTDLMAGMNGPRSVTVFVPPPDDELVRRILHKAVTQGRNQVLRARNMAIVYWLAFTGLRRAEVCGLRRVDVERDGEIRKTVIVTGKGARQRAVGVPPEVRRVTREWFDTRVDRVDALFINSNFEPMTIHTLSSLFQRLKKKLAAEKLGTHDLRRWFFNRLVIEGVPINEIRSLGGWNSWHAAQHYIHFGTEAVAAQRHSELEITI